MMMLSIIERRRERIIMTGNRRSTVYTAYKYLGKEILNKQNILSQFAQVCLKIFRS